MSWFTHFTRPSRRGLPPGGRNHVRRSRERTLCGLAVDPWIARPYLIMDPLSGGRAYPDCKRCRDLAARAGEAVARAA